MCSWLAPRIEPYHGEPPFCGWGYGFEGSVDRALGQCALVFGDTSTAIDLFEQAIALEEAFGAPVLAARTRWWPAKTLLVKRTDSPASASRERARSTARHPGLGSLARARTT
jgi:hypothetical protein